MKGLNKKLRCTALLVICDIDLMITSASDWNGSCNIAYPDFEPLLSRLNFEVEGAKDSNRPQKSHVKRCSF